MLDLAIRFAPQANWAKRRKASDRNKKRLVVLLATSAPLGGQADQGR
jgi:hypothetical protein